MGGQRKGSRARRRQRGRTGVDDITGLSAQDRMKIRMQNKAKNKTADKYSIHQLLAKTEEYLDNFNFEMAQLFCQRALELEPDNLEILDMMGNICMELGSAGKAKEVFLKAVHLSPDKGHAKYMSLGQIHCKEEAVQYFQKGLEVMISAYQSQPPVSGAASFSAEPEVTAQDISAAFCSVAEIYLTDLCMEEGAGEKCKEAISKALEYDGSSPEALQLMASYLFSMEQPQEGKEYLMKSLASWLPSLQKNKGEVQKAEEEDLVELASHKEISITPLLIPECSSDSVHLAQTRARCSLSTILRSVSYTFTKYDLIFHLLTVLLLPGICSLSVVSTICFLETPNTVTYDEAHCRSMCP